MAFLVPIGYAIAALSSAYLSGIIVSALIFD